jgi:hypothetical protein
MKRREFMTRGSLTLAALTTSEQWLNAVIAGRPEPRTSIMETYFQAGKAVIDKMPAAALAKGADFADVFFEYRITSTLSFEEDIVRSARRGVVQGGSVAARH